MVTSKRLSMQTTEPNKEPQDNADEGSSQKVRLDRWLWAARFFKTRAQAKLAVEGGKVQINGQRSKPGKEIGIGQELSIRRGDELFDIVVAGLAQRRGSAKVAAILYQETTESAARRAADAARRRMERAGLSVPKKKPNKHDRRALQQLKQSDE